MIDLDAIVVMFIRAAATKYAGWAHAHLLGARRGDRIYDNYLAANHLRYEYER